ncbi:MAG TPA: DNA-binding response regulator [Pararobbsia sp.]|nr:DNA-binding response regulator [Pararobbsia sp.]
MNSSTHVVFVANEDDTLVNLASDLSRLGFAVHLHQDLHTLHSAFVLDACPLLLVGVMPNAVNDAVMRVRALHPTAGLIAYSLFAGSEQRVRTLLCGADHCVERGTSAVEVAALLRALVRRGADILASTAAATARVALPREVAATGSHGPVGSSSLWRLTNKGWTLVAPSGRALALTAGERDLMRRFFAAPDRKIQRESERGNEHAGPADGVKESGVSPRVVDVMISRLRRKASQKQIGLPIRSVPGLGYVFAGDTEQIEHDAQHEGGTGQPAISASNDSSTCSA